MGKGKPLRLVVSLFSIFISFTLFSTCYNNSKYFNLEISDFTKSLVDSVETYFKRELRCEIVENLNAESKLENDGTPTIILSKTVGVSELEFLHELYHLYLKTKGFTDIKYNCSKFNRNELDLRNLISVWSRYIRDPIQHSYMYPLLKSKGFDIDYYDRTLLTEFLKKELRKNPDRILFLIQYFKFSLEVQDENLLKELDEYYSSNFNALYLYRGKELVKSIKDMMPLNPEKEVYSFIKVLNSLYENEIYFNLNSFKDSTYSNAKTKWAIIDVEFN